MEAYGDIDKKAAVLRNERFVDSKGWVGMEKVRVFVSWSGADSATVAEAWREALPLMFNATEPWLSSTDIEKGTSWWAEISSQLERASIGIICLTPDNLTSQWLHFEAGALAKIRPTAFVCTYLVGVKKNEVPQPLALFQATEASREDTFNLIKTINGRLGPMALTEKQCEVMYERWWPSFGGAIAGLRNRLKSTLPRNEDRPLNEMMAEILELLRGAVSDKEQATGFAPKRRDGNFLSDLVRLFAVAMDLGWEPYDRTVLNDLVTMISELKQGHTEAAFRIAAELRRRRAAPDYVRAPDLIQGMDRAFMYDPENIP